MPELPEVETIRRALENRALGKKITNIHIRNYNLRRCVREDLTAQIMHACFSNFRRRGKYLMCDLDNQMTLLIHFGMSGIIRFEPAHINHAPFKHDHVIITLGDNLRMIYHDPRRFGFIECLEQERVATDPSLVSLGPEPLSKDFMPSDFYGTLRGRGAPIKNVLLDQTVLAGLGNIYACEALFEAEINPKHKACRLGKKRVAVLHSKIRDVLERAVKAGGSSLKDYRQADGSPGYFQHQFCVYNKAGFPCPGCVCQARLKSVEENMQEKRGIRKITQSGRSTFYCPVRQS